MYLATTNRSFRLAGAARPRNVSPRRRLGRLGQSSSGGVITPQVAVQEAIQQSGVQSSIDPRFLANTAGLQKWYSMIEAGQFDLAWVSPSCVGANAPNSGVTNLSLTQAAGSIAGTATGAAASAEGGSISAIMAGTASTAGVVLGAATLGIGFVVAIISAIFAHHAQAVAQEQHIECTVTSAANNAMSALAEGVQSGQIQPADAVTALNSIYSQYKQIAAPSWGTHPYCNANCELEILMLAMVLYWQAQYTAMADQQAANPVGTGVATVATSLGLPTWALFAAGAFLLYELV